jgi:hypothetical protein
MDVQLDAVIFSKDKAKIFFTNSNMQIPNGHSTITFTFRHYECTGLTYSEVAGDEKTVIFKF